METLMETIQRMIADRQERHIEPCHIPYVDLQRERNKMLHDELNGLYHDGKVDVVKLINGYAVKLKK